MEECSIMVANVSLVTVLVKVFASGGGSTPPVCWSGRSYRPCQWWKGDNSDEEANIVFGSVGSNNRLYKHMHHRVNGGKRCSRSVWQDM